MKRIIAGVMTFIMTISLLTGCGQTSADKKANALPDNEVVTMRPYDTSKPTVNIGVCDNVNEDRLLEALNKQFPDLSIVIRHVGQSAFEAPNGLSDLYFFQSSEMAEDIEAYYLNLSSFDCSTKYYATSLQECVSVHDGNQYLLPCPATIKGIVYNKTMFAENGWEVPHGKTEFIELCHTIQDSGVVERAFMTPFKYTVATLTFAEMFNQKNLFSTLDYYTWQDDYAQVDTTVSSDQILAPMIGVFQEFLDEGLIELSDFDMMPADRSMALYKNRTAAMSIETQEAQNIADGTGSTDEFGLFPFYSDDSEESGYVQSAPVAYMCVDKRLGEEANKEKLANVTRILDYLSSEEGVDAFMPPDGIVIPQIKDYNIDYTSEGVLADCEQAITAGRFAPVTPILKGCDTQSKKVFDRVINAVLDTSRHINPLTEDSTLLTYEEAVQYMDDFNKALRSGTGYEVETVYATATEQFSVLETSEYYAQMFKDKANADIGLCINNGTARANFTAIKKGDLFKTTATSVNVMNYVNMLDSFYRGNRIDENDMKLVKLSMTGNQILQALEYPDCCGSGIFEGHFVAAGLKIEFAPWAEKGSRFLSVTLANGSKLEPDKLYTVATWNHTVSADYVTEVLEVYEDSFQDMLIAQLTKDKEIAPFKDGRFVLNWDVRAEEKEK